MRKIPKDFRQRQPDGNGGWRWDLHAVRRVLYRLPQLLAADPLQVFVAEGEKDVDALRDRGLVATCNPGGARKWRADYNEHLRGRHAVILPDNDKDGIPDTADKCPNQPETLNGNKDDDGCPDAGAEIVRLAAGRIEVR